MRRVSRTCIQCGETFHASVSEVNRGNGKFCSKKCCGLFNVKEKVHKICAYCGSDFSIHGCYERRKGGGRFCSLKCYHDDQRKNNVIEYNGDIFYKTPHGYYRSALTGNVYHRKIWEDVYGAVPTGCHVHHKDENKENNSIDNLVMVTKSYHAKIHYNRLLLANRNRPVNLCTVEGCSGRVKAHGLCGKHSQRKSSLRSRGYSLEEATRVLADEILYKNRRRL